MTTSGTSNWFLDNAGVITEAYSRCGIRPTALTREHFFAATRSLNLALQSWSNKGVNLWQVDLQSVPLVQGTASYTLPSNTVNILDAYLETYDLATTVNQAPNFSTVINTTTVTVVQNAHGLISGNWVDIVTQISIGGIILSGLYIVTVLDQNTYTIQSATAATSTVNNSGTVPSFQMSISSATVTCTLANHGLVAGNQFTVGVATSVGSVALFGVYTVGAVTNANVFTFTAQNNAASNDTESENGGNVQLQTQANGAPPFDRIMTSISRTDYAAQPNKQQQGPPTTFWFDRTSPIPSITLWEVPDGSGPYAFFYYRMRRIQDAYAISGQTADVPYRFLDALCADLAARVARKYAPQLVESLTMEAKEAWAMATEEDRERVQVFVVPELSGYFN